MIIRYMDKLFSLQPRANAVEYGVIAAVIGVAVIAAALALADPITTALETILHPALASAG
jgi:Flp pilus assembly pilin Flp